MYNLKDIETPLILRNCKQGRINSATLIFGYFSIYVHIYFLCFYSNISSFSPNKNTPLFPYISMYLSIYLSIQVLKEWKIVYGKSPSGLETSWPSTKFNIHGVLCDPNLLVNNLLLTKDHVSIKTKYEANQQLGIVCQLRKNLLTTSKFSFSLVLVKYVILGVRSTLFTEK